MRVNGFLNIVFITLLNSYFLIWKHFKLNYNIFFLFFVKTQFYCYCFVYLRKVKHKIIIIFNDGEDFLRVFVDRMIEEKESSFHF